MSSVHSLPDGAGVLFVGANHINYVLEAFESAQVVKELFPDLATALFTDLADEFDLDDGIFDHLVELEPCHDYPEHSSLNGKLGKIRSLRRSPFANTFYIDAHAKVADLDAVSIFTMLDHYDMALVEARPESSRSRRDYGKRMFLTGVIGFRRCKVVTRLLEDWEAVVKRHFALAFSDEPFDVPHLAHVPEPARRNLLHFDQIALAGLLGPEHSVHSLNVKQLDPSWNFRTGDSIPAAPIKLDTRTEHKRTSSDLREYIVD